MRIKKGATDQTIYFEVLDSTSTTGGRKTGLAYDTASLVAYYTRTRGTATAITLVTLAAADSAHSDGGFKEVSSSNAPGVYRLDLPDAAVATGAELCAVTIKGATGMVQQSFLVELVDNLESDVYSRIGAPAGASIAADLVTIDDFLDTEVAAIKAKTDNLPTDPADQSAVEAAISAAAAPSAATVADAVWDEAIAGHLSAGSTGLKLNSAASAGDPWSTVVPGAYADGTAGAAVGRLNNTAADEPVTIVPGAPSDVALCNVYVYTENIINVKRSGIVIGFELTGPAKSERVLETAGASMTTDSNGFAYVALQRTDALTPAGCKYKVNAPALGLRNTLLELTATTKDLADLIT